MDKERLRAKLDLWSSRKREGIGVYKLSGCNEFEASYGWLNKFK